MITAKEISELQTMSEEFRASVEYDLTKVSIPWREAYSDYQSGGWYVAQLINSSGSAEQIKIDGGSPIATPLLNQIPTIKQLIDETALDIRVARLARISPGSWMHEHNDDVGIGEERQRLHIPITSNPKAVLCFDGAHVHLEPGFLWKLDHERVPHAAANYGDDDRVHLILDCRMNDALRRLVDSERMNPEAIRTLPVLDDQAREELVTQARALIQRGESHAGEESLLETFCLYDLRGRSCYDLLLAAYEGIEGSEDRVRLWRERLKEVRGREDYR